MAPSCQPATAPPQSPGAAPAVMGITRRAERGADDELERLANAAGQASASSNREKTLPSHRGTRQFAKAPEMRGGGSAFRRHRWAPTSIFRPPLSAATKRPEFPPGQRPLLLQQGRNSPRQRPLASTPRSSSAVLPTPTHPKRAVWAARTVRRTGRRHAS